MKYVRKERSARARRAWKPRRLWWRTEFNLPMVLPVLLLLQCQWVAAAGTTANSPISACAAPPGRRASCYTQRWLSPPHSVPSGSSTDGPVIGNGDMGVVATGNAGVIQL